MNTRINRPKLLLANLKLFTVNYATERKTNTSFIFQIIKFGTKGLVAALILVISLATMDFLFNQLLTHKEWSLVDTISTVEKKIGFKKLEYFVEVLNIIGGVLGVLLGLFFTSFITIVNTKYSNVQQSVRHLILNQKQINKFFSLLATLTSASILMQFSLAIGYQPTILAAFIYIFLVVVSLFSFIKWGKTTMHYLDRSILTIEIFDNISKVLLFIKKYKKEIELRGQEKIYINKIIRELNNVEILLQVCSEEDAKNHSLDNSTTSIRNFLFSYNQIKYTIPSYGNWEIKTQGYKSWVIASSSEISIAMKTGTPLSWIDIPDHNWIENRLIQIQFRFFEEYVQQTKKKIVILREMHNQDQYIQTLAFQNEIQLFSNYFDKLKTFLIEDFLDDEDTIETRHIACYLYSALIINYFVGLNYNLGIYRKENISKLGSAIHNFKRFDNIIPIPYSLRKKIDEHILHLKNEFELEKHLKTPISYTVFFINNNLQQILQEHFFEAVIDAIKKSNDFTHTLIQRKQFFEVGAYSLSILQLAKKLPIFADTIEITINSFESSYIESKKFSFAKKEDISNAVKEFNKTTIENIWQYGGESYKVKEKQLPDIFGQYYQVIHDDLVDRLLSTRYVGVEEYLKKYMGVNYLYIKKIRQEYVSDNPLRDSRYYYPFIIDLLEIISIALISSRIHNYPKIENEIFSFWNNLFENDTDNESKYWGFILAVYDYYSTTYTILSTESHNRELNRSSILERYLMTNNFIKEEVGEEKYSYHKNTKYKSIVDDYMLKTIANLLYNSRLIGLKLSEICIEHYLKTIISSKKVTTNIKTKYGEAYFKTMAKNS